MTNALDYLSWRGDLSFSQSPVNEVDLFLCSQLVTPDYTDIVSRGPKEIPLKEASAAYFRFRDEAAKNLGVLQSKYVLPALKAMGKCARFKNAGLFCYSSKVDPENNEQFGAMTVRLTEDLIVICYRGTDDTIVGWKEDCLLAVSDRVPAQQDALDYLTRAAAMVPECRIIVTGHSKGGNLAIYAAAMAEADIQKRIVRAVGFDSPGFRDSILSSPGYCAIRDRVTTVLSQNSTVGTLLNMSGNYIIVHSSVFGPLAHDGFNWEVMGPGFTREEKLSDFSEALATGTDEVIASMTDEEKVEFIHAVFDTLSETGAVTLTELTERGLISSLVTLSKVSSHKNVRTFVEKLCLATERSSQTLEEIRISAQRILSSIRPARNEDAQT